MSDELAQRLRGSGYRLTHQRRLILEAVTHLGHATAEEVANEVRTEGINTSTVYRNLEVLEGLGLVQHTHLTDRAATYHVVGGVEHVHLVCRKCQRIQSVETDVVAPLVESLRVTRGFVVDVGHLAIFGHCVNCEARPVESHQPAHAHQHVHTHPASAGESEDS